MDVFYSELLHQSGVMSIQPRVGHGLDSSMDWIGLDWIGSICGRNCMDWTGLGQMTDNCLESEIFRDSKLDWSNSDCILAFSVCVAFSDF